MTEDKGKELLVGFSKVLADIGFEDIVKQTVVEQSWLHKFLGWHSDHALVWSEGDVLEVDSYRFFGYCEHGRKL